MALDVMRIYQKKPGKQGSSDQENKVSENKDEEGASFAQKGEKGSCYKCGAPDYKTCPCDNMKNEREREQRKAETSNLHVEADENFAFNQVDILEGKTSQEVTDCCPIIMKSS